MKHSMVLLEEETISFLDSFIGLTALDIHGNRTVPKMNPTHCTVALLPVTHVNVGD